MQIDAVMESLFNDRFNRLDVVSCKRPRNHTPTVRPMSNRDQVFSTNPHPTRSVNKNLGLGVPDVLPILSASHLWMIIIFFPAITLSSESYSALQKRKSNTQVSSRFALDSFLALVVCTPDSSEVDNAPMKFSEKSGILACWIQ